MHVYAVHTACTVYENKPAETDDDNYGDDYNDDDDADDDSDNDSDDDNDSDGDNDSDNDSDIYSLQVANMRIEWRSEVRVYKALALLLFFLLLKHSPTLPFWL